MIEHTIRRGLLDRAKAAEAADNREEPNVEAVEELVSALGAMTEAEYVLYGLEKLEAMKARMELGSGDFPQSWPAEVAMNSIAEFRTLREVDSSEEMQQRIDAVLPVVKILYPRLPENPLGN